jgi:NTP pyrophosphatase (non-canonical NTP hydrolase)
MDELCLKIQELRKSRGWLETDTDAILAKSIIIEAAELLECYQWDEQNIDKEAIKSEIADVLMYTISLCIHYGWDYKEVVLSKFDDIKSRYPSVK